MTAQKDHAAIKVDLVALPETGGAAIYSLRSALSSVGVFWPYVTGAPAQGPRMTCRVVAPEATPFVSAAGVPVVPDLAFDEATDADIIIASDLMISVRRDPRGRWPKASDWLRARHDAGAMICSVCSGSLLLAEAGLLDGEEATTHWAYAGLFQRYYPQVTLRAERLLTTAGGDERILTSGGATAWEDLTLHLIERYCGPEEAVRVAKIFLLGDHADGQLPFAAPPIPRRHEDRVIGEAQGWIGEHYAESNPVARMVAASGLSERSFNRRFKRATGYAPVQYVQNLRIEEAKQMLERSALPVDAVAQEVGYEDPTHFRRLFKRLAGVTPARYRRRFTLAAPARASARASVA